MFFISSRGADIKLVKEIARKTDMRLWPNEKNPVFDGRKKRIPKKLFLLVDTIEPDLLSDLLTKCVGIIDITAHKKRIISFLKRQQEENYAQSLSFLMTGTYIYQYDIAGLFSAVLQQKRGFSDARRQTIHLALHEALANGLLHGNLALSSSLRQTTQGVFSYSELIDKRLHQTAYKHKAICVCAFWDKGHMEIKVQDEGHGFVLDKILKKADTSITAKSGRGLQMIARSADSCTLENCGRKITLSFLRENEINKSIADLPLDTDEKSDISDCRVLIIDNDKNNQALLAELLTQMGLHKIDVASDGAEGLNKALSLVPDLIILDVFLPQIDGYEVLKRLRATALGKNVPVLLQSPLDTREFRDRSFKAGACDFLTKPVNPLEFFARVRVYLENTRLFASLTRQLNQINSELKSAQKMQHNLLPRQKQVKALGEAHNLEIVSYFEPSAELGGDFWQILPISEEKIGIYLCDFSGHGLAAALNTFRMHTLIFNQAGHHIKKPSDFLAHLNHQLCQLLERGQFATFFFCIFDVKNNILQYSGAGTPPPFLRTNKGIRLLHTRGLPLGISKEAVYEDYEVPFTKGDKLLLYSDALIENELITKERAQLSSFLQMVRPYLKENVSVALKEIVKLCEETQKQPLDDDVTIVMVEGI